MNTTLEQGESKAVDIVSFHPPALPLLQFRFLSLQVLRLWSCSAFELSKVSSPFISSCCTEEIMINLTVGYGFRHVDSVPEMFNFL